MLFYSGGISVVGGNAWFGNDGLEGLVPGRLGGIGGV